MTLKLSLSYYFRFYRRTMLFYFQNFLKILNLIYFFNLRDCQLKYSYLIHGRNLIFLITCWRRCRGWNFTVYMNFTIDLHPNKRWLRNRLQARKWKGKNTWPLKLYSPISTTQNEYQHIMSYYILLTSN